MPRHLSEIDDPKAFEAAFYGKHGITPADALRRIPAPVAALEERTQHNLTFWKEGAFWYVQASGGSPFLGRGASLIDACSDWLAKNGLQ